MLFSIHSRLQYGNPRRTCWITYHLVSRNTILPLPPMELWSLFNDLCGCSIIILLFLAHNYDIHFCVCLCLCLIDDDERRAESPPSLTLRAPKGSRGCVVEQQLRRRTSLFHPDLTHNPFHPSSTYPPLTNHATSGNRILRLGERLSSRLGHSRVSNIPPSMTNSLFAESPLSSASRQM